MNGYKEKINSVLKNELVVAMGCTEPAASALAGAKAASLLDGDVVSLDIETSRDMVKNAMGVGIPGCDLKGIQIAVALGAAVRDISKGLGILTDLVPEQVDLARTFRTTLTMVENIPPLYIKVKAFSENESAVAIISGAHSRFAHLEKNGEVLLDLPLIGDCSTTDNSDDEKLMEHISLYEIISYSANLDKEIKDLMLFAAETNKAIAEEALHGDYGLSVGRIMYRNLPEDIKSLSDVYTKGCCYAAAASDARMSGCCMPVVINSGSGNQGITITLPIYILGEYLKKDDDEIARAICIAELVGLALTARKDRLSALCGAFTAAIACACGMVYLQDGGINEMNRAINVMVGNLSGIICDGAKMTCALKIFSSLQAASVAVSLAFAGNAPSSESGIVGKDCFESIDFLSRLSHEGMLQVDRTILNIMMDKQKK